MTLLTVPNFLFACMADIFSSLTTVFFMPIIMFAVVLLVVGVIKYVLSNK